MLKQKVFAKIGAGLLLTLLIFSFVAGTDCCSFVKTEVAQAATTKAPKYVFYFIGDGLGSSQRSVAEYFLQEKTGDKTAKLTMNMFPIAGINTTYSTDTLVTDSAAAGTALATGHKTKNGMISILPDGKTAVKSLIAEAEAKGMATGIITTTRLTHATPAVFAAHNENRNNENEIAADFVDSGVDFFAGGGYRHFVPKTITWGKSKREDDRSITQEFFENDYKIFIGDKSGSESFKNYQPTGKEKVFAAFTYSHLPYEIDRINSGSKVPSLAEMTAKGIEVLSKYNKGFFMMIEGGRIDHACHANDPAGTIYDTLAFDEAVKVAYDFYKKHPQETLIVVIGDHETGGMGLGFGKNYFLNMDELLDVKVSLADVLQDEYKGDRAAYFTYIEQNIGLDNLTAEEKAKITKAMDLVDSEIDPGNTYGGYDPVATVTTHLLSERANLFWTTYAHSGTVIPLTAIGQGDSGFGGYKDNTEIAETMAELMGFKLTTH